ncbi:DNA methyltransferase [Rhodanobacter sp. FW510-R12]|uniref:class I SAM-dependent DNA methyltransferase n=1 Tax=Rhodanobacter thiooxydans TaxID=416169 RepID=UPI000916000A|nr:DNA methyltransferase [Rhodanobacter thiooxydans]UJJ56645.1 class I SAM-dependent DNA methyltransferase [Rhodanobacter thiooxydans]
MPPIQQDASEAFIAKWRGVTASELSTAQSFAMDLCHLLGVEPPHPDPDQQYMFERPVTFAHGDGSSSAGRIDLYRRSCFVLEAKKLKAPTHTKGFDDAMLRARSQAEQYARALPAAEGRPPFLIVVDVGNRIELYAEFSRSGGTYTPFPDPRSHRIALEDLARDTVRERLRKVWTDPLSLDPSRESARVTREIAGRLAALARSLEAAGHPAESVAQFLMRCLFTMFAEDVRLLPEDSFRILLQTHAEQPETAMRMLSRLWQDMDGGGFSAAIATDVLRFNGKLFKQPDTLPLTREQIALLIEAAKAKWEHVEPAIFGTLLERALDPSERHKLGAHYTPRAHVERLVLPAVIEPLRDEWGDAHAAALTLATEGKSDDAVHVLRQFHHRLCTVRVLDPACGSGNFLYVTLEHLKRLEGEVLNALDELGYRQTGLALSGERADAMGGETVDPHQLLGVELNPRAAAIAEVVLWIGYLQWHFRTRGDVNPPQPVIRDFRNIENRDAVLAYDAVELVTGEHGVPVTRWDGKTMKRSAVTGEPVPDETSRVPLERYVNPRKAAWPEADFLVGNPPFIGTKRMKSVLGDGYVEALRATWSDVPESADFVMYWWHIAALNTTAGKVKRFGLITTNSISQTFNRRVMEGPLTDPKRPISLTFAIPDHPWVDASDGAAVRIAMTVGMPGRGIGQLARVIEERETETDDREVILETSQGLIHADLRVGADVGSARPLMANERIAGMGVALHGSGFILTPEDAERLRVHGPGIIKPYIGGRDLLQRPRERYLIDFFGLTQVEARAANPAAFQHVIDYVKPERDHNNRTALRELWWRFGWERPVLRRSMTGLSRYIGTTETSKHRVFQFIDGCVLADHKILCIACDDAAILGVLSSIIHSTWSDTVGGRLGVGNDPVYNKTRCFDPFPFPEFDQNDKLAGSIAMARVDRDGQAGPREALATCPSERLRELGEQLDAHRKRQQATHPDLTLTAMYNVLEKLRGGESLTGKERVIHEQGLVSLLRHLHDEIDEAVLDAYGWADLLHLLRVAHGNDVPAANTSREDAQRAFDEVLLERLVALNSNRAAEEARGQVMWLRPAFQNPSAEVAPDQRDFQGDSLDDDAPAAVIGRKPEPWPKDAVAQVRAVADTLAATPVPLDVDEIAARFTARGPWKKRLPQLLHMLVALGRARVNNGKYSTL